MQVFNINFHQVSSGGEIMMQEAAVSSVIPGETVIFIDNVDNLSVKAVYSHKDHHVVYFHVIKR